MGQRIGSYSVTATLGRGGYGEVLAATHDVIGRDVAIKILHAKWSDDPEAVRRFVAEARAVNAVRHPNIVDVVDFGRLDDGRHYHVMERLHGESLRARLDARGSLSIAEAAPILRAVAAALDAAHDAGIVHRDVKPENVFLCDDNRIKLIDFGLAKLATSDGAPTQSGVILGTPAYMAPEQCRGHEVERRTDSYAFGVLAYEMLTGSVPLRGDDPIATLLAHVHETPRAPSAIAALPRAVDAAILPLLAKGPGARPERLVPVVDALAACEGRPLRTRIRTRWLALGGGAVLACAALAFALAPNDAPTTPAPAAPPARTQITPPIAAAPSELAPPLAATDAGVAEPEAPHGKSVRVTPEAIENPYR